MSGLPDTALLFVDAEVLERSDEITEETDIEEQFSSPSKGSPSKPLISFEEFSDLDSNMQPQHSEEISHAITFAENSAAGDRNEQIVEEQRKVTEISSSWDKRLSFATESDELFQEETVLQFEKSQIVEEAASCLITEGANVHMAALDEHQNLQTLEAKGEAFPFPPLTETDRVECFIVEEKHATVHTSVSEAETPISSAGTDHDTALHLGPSAEPVTSVVSLESRRAQHELLQEITDETDRSVSPSGDAEKHPSTFKTQVELHDAIAEEPESDLYYTVVQGAATCPVTDHPHSESLGDDEVCVSFETDKHFTGGKLSQADEDATLDTQQKDDALAKPVPCEKKVTFRTDTLSTPRVSEQSSDEYKMSTSSSEMSAEPTLLEASYDLDSGRVCHVVSALDITPHSLDSKGTSAAPSKSILPSPDDDVFETDIVNFFQSERTDTVLREDAEDVTVTEQLSAASTSQARHEIESTASETKLQDEDLQAVEQLDELTVREEDLSSPFEIITASELMEAYEIAANMPSERLEAGGEPARYTDVQTSDLREGTLTSDPADTQFITERDTCVEATTAVTEDEIKIRTEEPAGSSEDITFKRGDTKEEECKITAGRDTIVSAFRSDEEKVLSDVEATSSELLLPPGVDPIHISTSEQTLYGLDMPNEETVVPQKDLIMLSEIGQEHEVTTDFCLETKQAGSELVVDIERSDVGRMDEAFHEEVTSTTALSGQQETEEETKDDSRRDKLPDDKSIVEAALLLSKPLEDEGGIYHLDPASHYPGKRALEIQIFMESKQGQQNIVITEENKQEEKPQTEVTVDDDDLLTEDEYMEQEAVAMEYMEKPEEELLHLKDSKPESEDEEEGGETWQKAESRFSTGLSSDDLERPHSPTPDSFRSHFFPGDYDKDAASPAQLDAGEGMEKTASHFVESILEDVKEKIQALPVDEPSADLIQESVEGEEEEEDEFYEAISGSGEVRAIMESDDGTPVGKDHRCEKELSGVPQREQTGGVSRAEKTSDVSCISITKSESGTAFADAKGAIDETDFSAFHDELYDQRISNVEEKEPKPVQTEDHVDGGKEEASLSEPSSGIDEQFEISSEIAERREPVMPPKEETVSEETDLAAISKPVTITHLPLKHVCSVAEEARAGLDEEEKERGVKKQEIAELSSPEDHGDSSSMDSFATVLVADPENEDEDDQDVEAKLAEIASMSSSIHSDILLTQGEFEERFEEIDKSEAEMLSPDDSRKETETPKESESSSSSDRYDSRDTELSSSVDSDRCTGREYDLSSSVESDRYGSNVELSSSVESDRYEFVDRAALSVITELSEEDQYEMLDKDDMGNETGPESDPQEQFHWSPPDGPSPSPRLSGTKYFTKALNDRDDASVSSSLQEFERLEKQAGTSGSSSIDTSDKESIGGSYDERKHPRFLGSSYDEKRIEYGSFDEKKLVRYRHEMEREDISATSSLAEFEKLERQIDQQGSTSSVEDKAAESKSSGGKSGSGSGSGSVSSLAEFEKLEAELATDSDDRRSSEDSSLHRRSETSSQASLNEFEKLEQDLAANSELEAEAQKIVSYLEAGSLDSGRMFYYSSSVGYSSSELSEGETAKQRQDRVTPENQDTEGRMPADGDDRDVEVDSLDGDASETTVMISSVIFAGSKSSPARSGGTHDSDVGESAMQLSSESHASNLKMPATESSRFDTDSEQAQEDMMRSVDSLDLEERQSDKYDPDTLQEVDVMQSSGDSLDLVQVGEQKSEDHMFMSVESAHWSMGSSGGTMYKSQESHTDSHDFMQVSAESMEDVKISQTEYTDKTELIQSVEFSPEGAPVEVMLCTSSSSSSSSTKLVKAHPTNPFLDEEGNVLESSGYSQDDDDEDDDVKESPFMYWGTYKEQKKVYTMAEWEEMKKEKLRKREEWSTSNIPQSADGELRGTWNLNVIMTVPFLVPLTISLPLTCTALC